MKEKTYPSDSLDKFMLRLPQGMREKIKACAEENGRSMNSEIVSRLEASFESFEKVDKLTVTNKELRAALKRIHELTGLAQDMKAHREEIDRKVAEMNEIVKERKAK